MDTDERGRAATELREAFGVGGACSRFRSIPVSRQRQQAGRTPNASRGSSPTATLAACEQLRLLHLYLYPTGVVLGDRPIAWYSGVLPQGTNRSAPILAMGRSPN